MVAPLALLALLVTPLASAPDSLPAAPPRDSAAAPARVVRRFPPIEVRAPLHDLRSSQTVHVLAGRALGTLPVEGVNEALALQPGVVVQGGEIHVRGGRNGETWVSLDGMTLSEPFRRLPVELPLLALERAELVSGAPEAQYAAGLAGVLDLHTVDPTARPSGEWRWQSDGRMGSHYDRVGARLAAPLRLLGLGAVAAGDVTLDDGGVPALRSQSRHDFAGLSLGWRAENRLLGFVKLAPVERPQRLTAQLAWGRRVHQPYDPEWSLDGWTFLPANPKASPIFSPVPLPGYRRYRAADHLAITDEEQIAAQLSASRLRTSSRATLGVGWLRTRAVTSVGGGHEGEDVVHRPRYNNPLDGERFHVLWGDYSLYRESAADVLTLRGDYEAAERSGSGWKTGAGLTYEQVRLRELDWMPVGWSVGGEETITPLDSVRAYRAFAPGAFAYVQGRWLYEGLVLNTGLRAEYFTAGPQADDQTLPGSDRGVWSFSPRLGLTYPLSPRDAFSLAYARLHQAPGRDYLYDRRVAISSRQPLGNPALEPVTVITYEASVKHVFGPAWALQGSVFYRDLFGEIGARDYSIPGGPTDLRYENGDEGQSAGFEWSLLHDAGERGRIEAHYTWMQAWGNESRSEGDPYGPIRGPTTPPIGDQPLSWDRRHTLLVTGTWPLEERVTVAWSTWLGSALPWTPKDRRQPVTDLGIVNSRRLEWSENTNVRVGWALTRRLGLRVQLEARNLFDNRGLKAATVDGYPNPIVNTRYDDYGAYLTETGIGGGAYWLDGVGGQPGRWVTVRDPRLFNLPRTVRASVAASW